MEFLAIDVNEGDCFVLKDDNYSIIIDGGKQKKGIVSKLKKNNIKYITQLGCTHYDSDHINGIIGICESSSFRINEIILPAVWVDLIYTLQINNENRDFFKNIYKYYTDNNLNSDNNGLPNYESLNVESDINTYEMIDLNILESICFSSDNFYFHYLGNRFIDFLPYISINILKKIARIILASIKSGAHIRWIKYQDKLTNHKISKLTELIALNGNEVQPCSLKPDIFILSLLCLSKINQESLVFKYHSYDKPNVLFSGDSNFSFLNGKALNLKDYSIVTAPHHGSQSNTFIYSLLKEKNIIFVRSDRFQNSRPCLDYIALQHKYCTTCKGDVAKNTVKLNYNEIWNTKNNRCICQ
ncbi:MAG TPA: hypothetical protein DDY71_16475 [Spirochaetia bacterium]|nr:MAG: hypothetical protein A2Y29_08950 [Spirochaetes bacterium GWE2_31_10]HBD94645.1 hypothetical protein [Spirochaetia bacterium]HBI39239.1 hypothetical protein [Spirochaetia bacterium]